MKSNTIVWLLRIIAAVIMLQTLFYKFSANPESVYIFTKLGIEPFGRIATGIAELIASVLLLMPRTSWLGAFLGVGIMAGAIVSHVLILGFEVMNDHGLLFILALITLSCCTLLLYLNRGNLMNILKTKNLNHVN